MSTGSSSNKNRQGGRLLALGAAAALLLHPQASEAQVLKLRTLKILPDVGIGNWVSYRGTIESKSRPPREFTQRIAVVSREGVGDQSGVWLELKSSEGKKTRIERGFFTRDRSGAMLFAARYQVVTADGRLMEYPVGSEAADRAEEEASAIALFDFLPGRSQDYETLPPDTLRFSRRVVPCVVERSRQLGSESWSEGDSDYVSRAVLTETLWKNPGVPITGYAKKIVDVSTERMPAVTPTAGTTPSAGTAPAAGTSPAIGASSSTAPPGDSLATAKAPAPGRRVYRAELTLLDIGQNAVPEITQEPEMGSEESTPKPGLVR